MRADLVEETALDGISAVLKRRILVAQALYALAMLIGLWNTLVGIGLIVLIQLNYAIAPRWGWLYRTL